MGANKKYEAAMHGAPTVTTKCVACGEQFEAAFMALALDRLATHQDTKKGCGL